MGRGCVLDSEQESQRDSYWTPKLHSEGNRSIRCQRRRDIEVLREINQHILLELTKFSRYILTLTSCPTDRPTKMTPSTPASCTSTQPLFIITFRIVYSKGIYSQWNQIAQTILNDLFYFFCVCLGFSFSRVFSPFVCSVNGGFIQTSKIYAIDFSITIFSAWIFFHF